MSPVIDNRDLNYNGLAVEYKVNPRALESFELFINAVLDKNDHLQLQFQYNAGLFGESEVRDLGAELREVYARLVEKPHALLGAHGRALGPAAALGPGDHPAISAPNRRSTVSATCRNSSYPTRALFSVIPSPRNIREHFPGFPTALKAPPRTWNSCPEVRLLRNRRLNGRPQRLEPRDLGGQPLDGGRGPST